MDMENKVEESTEKMAVDTREIEKLTVGGEVFTVTFYECRRYFTVQSPGQELIFCSNTGRAVIPPSSETVGLPLKQRSKWPLLLVTEIQRRRKESLWEFYRDSDRRIEKAVLLAEGNVRNHIDKATLKMGEILRTRTARFAANLRKKYCLHQNSQSV